MRFAALLAIALGLSTFGCADRPSTVPAIGDCEGDVSTGEDRSEVVTVAEVFSDATLVWHEHFGTAPIARSRFYAVVDDEGFVGTLQAMARNMRCAHLAMEGSCRGFEEWNTRWLDEPTRAWGSIGRGRTLAFGPANARFVSARRLVPARATYLDENNAPMPAPPSAVTSRWTELAAIATNEATFEVWGRRCANGSASVRELRVVENGRSRVVERTARRDYPGD